MRKLSSIAAAVCTTFAVGSANALFVVMDDFQIPAPATFVTDQLGGGSTSSGAAINATPSGFARTFTHELLSGGGPPTAVGNFVGIGSTTFPTGALEVANTSGHDSQATVNWTIAANYVTSTASQFGLMVLITDGNPTSVNLKIGATDLGSINLPTGLNLGSGPGQLVLFPTFSAAQLAAVQAGGLLTMTIDGASGWDLSVDQVGFQIPEPGSMALVGLALLGAGVASRRRSA